jgi:hypothetical protein
MLTYVGLGLYAAVRKSADDSDVQRVRVLLTFVSFVVNVVTI